MGKGKIIRGDNELIDAFSYSFASVDFPQVSPKLISDLLPREFSAQKLLGLLLIVSALGLAIPSKSLAQKRLKSDYIVVADTSLSQGVVEYLPSENNAVIYFARTKKEDKVRYTIGDITEFRVSERMFFRREVELYGMATHVFLEKLPRSVPEATIWKLNGPPNLYFLETPKGIRQLGENYREELKDALGNPMLDPLLALTRLNDLSLTYLFRTANTIQRPRTFPRLVAFTPYLGYSSQSVGLIVPNSDHQAKITGSSPALGITGEVFVTFRRNLSLNVGLLWTQFDAQDFVQYQYSQTRYESDVFLDFSMLQVPVTAKYYLDLKPNKWRLFGEVGYSYVIPSYDKLGVYQAKFEDDGIETSVRGLGMSARFSGVTWGVGVEKYLSKHQGIVLGFRGFEVDGASKDSVKGLIFHLGYKF